MLAAAIILMTIGSFGVGAAVLLELKHHEPIYMLLIKIFPWIFGVGAVLLGISL
jgi:hypothetical protein